ncbi:MAG: SO_0444 family Cu/Zn efflux transporter [Thermodesulfobacteriota bacterium]
MVPAVAGFKKQGASNGACLSLLISTPETGVDSLALTYSLLDPIMTVFRPIGAFVTAMVAGTVDNFSGRPGTATDDHLGLARSARRSIAGNDDFAHIRTANACCAGTDTGSGPDPSCGDKSLRLGKDANQDSAGMPPGEPAPVCGSGSCCESGENSQIENTQRSVSPTAKLRGAVLFAVNDLMGDLAHWLLLGFLLAGVITVIVPESLISGYLGSGLVSYLGVLAVSLPMYVCASASTPIAAALVAKGMSPGAALVFLMAGPATNAATITMVGGMLGRRTLGIYIGSIVLCTLGLAYVADLLYGSLGLSVNAVASRTTTELIPGWLETASAVLVGLLIARVMLKKALTWRRPAAQAQAVQTEAALACGCASTAPGET